MEPFQFGWKNGLRMKRAEYRCLGGSFSPPKQPALLLQCSDLTPWMLAAGIGGLQRARRRSFPTSGSGQREPFSRQKRMPGAAPAKRFLCSCFQLAADKGRGATLRAALPRQRLLDGNNAGLEDYPQTSAQQLELAKVAGSRQNSPILVMKGQPAEICLASWPLSDI